MCCVWFSNQFNALLPFLTEMIQISFFSRKFSFLSSYLALSIWIKQALCQIWCHFASKCMCFFSNSKVFSSFQFFFQVTESFGLRFHCVHACKHRFNSCCSTNNAKLIENYNISVKKSWLNFEKRRQNLTKIVEHKSEVPSSATIIQFDSNQIWSSNS